ncbi:MAG TPA: hypothetical protein DCX14_08425 [Flavobacteriales bacterium]|jgi:hypothetical protein|nr:hypothetical protein [Flavobacteriales bacterium]
MSPQEIETIASHLIGQYGWMFAAGVTILTFKNIIQRFVEGLMFFIGNDYNADDIVYINGSKKARITRHGLTKTVLYIYDTERKLIVRNDKLSSLYLEKSLPQNGGVKRNENN